jgi:hypothetical protein
MTTVTVIVDAIVAQLPPSITDITPEGKAHLADLFQKLYNSSREAETEIVDIRDVNVNSRGGD